MRMTNDYNTRDIADLAFTVLKESTKNPKGNSMRLRQRPGSLRPLGPGISESSIGNHSPQGIFHYLGVPVL